MSVIADIKAQISFREYAARHLELTREGRYLKACCPFHSDRSPSFVVYEDSFHCFGCGAHGDLLDFICKVHRCDIRDAGRYVGVAPTMNYTTPAPPEPEDWVEKPANEAQNLPDLSRFDVVYPYNDASGNIIRYIVRINNHKGRGKLILPQTYGVLDGKLGWHARHSKNRGLYRQDFIAAQVECTVIVTEGEKAANAAQALFPRRVVCTWSGGSNAVQRADFTPLSGRRVILWPDADAPGIQAMDRVAAILKQLGAKLARVRVADLEPGADAADITTNDPETWLQSRLERI